ncbi:MAG: phospholipase D-like domain-containing protein [Candidatus Micrarchaeota archaeon]
MAKKSFQWVLGALVLGIVIGIALSSIYLQPTSQTSCASSVTPILSPGSEDEMISFLRSAEHSIDVEVYVFTYPKFIDELEAAQDRGVSVRVIIEPRVNSDSNDKTMSELKLRGISARWASQTFQLTHSKLILVDGKRVWVGSPNWSYSAFNKNREAAVVIEDEKLAQEFMLAFESDWKIGANN